MILFYYFIIILWFWFIMLYLHHDYVLLLCNYTMIFFYFFCNYTTILFCCCIIRIHGLVMCWNKWQKMMCLLKCQIFDIEKYSKTTFEHSQHGWSVQCFCLLLRKFNFSTINIVEIKNNTCDSANTSSYLLCNTQLHVLII